MLIKDFLMEVAILDLKQKEFMKVIKLITLKVVIKEIIIIVLN